MDFIIWFIIGAGFLFLCLFTLGGIILYKVQNKNKIRINILLKARRWSRFKLHIKKVGKEIMHNGGRYVFNDKAIIKGTYVDDIYYFEGNPEPIIFDFGSNIPLTQAQDLQTILDSDLIEKLFSEKRLARMEMLLLIILIITFIILGAVIGSYFMKPSIDTQGNAEFIANVTRTVIRGG
jgi:hypothetical protein